LTSKRNDVDLSHLTDTVVLLRYFEFQGVLTGVPTYTGALSPLLGKDVHLAGS